MMFGPLYELLPEQAFRETRSVTIWGNPHLPDGEYGLLEFYCTEPGCDCRRVMFYVVTPTNPEPLAVVAYGWESAAFYAGWYGEDDPEMIHQLQGPVLNFGSRQSKLAPALLALVSQLLQDEAYVARLKRHYELYKQKVNEQAGHSLEKRSRPAKPATKKRRRR